jgi:hypothetical protein
VEVRSRNLKHEATLATVGLLRRTAGGRGCSYENYESSWTLSILLPPCCVKLFLRKVKFKDFSSTCAMATPTLINEWQNLHCVLYADILHERNNKLLEYEYLELLKHFNVTWRLHYSGGAHVSFLQEFWFNYVNILNLTEIINHHRTKNAGTCIETLPFTFGICIANTSSAYWQTSNLWTPNEVADMASRKIHPSALYTNSAATWDNATN